MQHSTPRSLGKWKPASARVIVCLAFTLMLPGKGVAKQSDPPAAHSSGVGTEIIISHGHADGVKDGAFFPGGNKLVTVGGDTTLRVWDTETGSLIGLYRGHEAEVNAVAVSPGGTRLVSGDVEGNVLLWSYGSNAGPRTLYTHKGSVQDVVFTDDDRALSLVFVEKGTLLVVHDLLSGNRSPSLFPSDYYGGEKASFLGNQYLLINYREQLTVYDLTTWKPVPILTKLTNKRISTNAHMLTESEILWSSSSLAGMDMSTGNGFELVNSCMSMGSKFYCAVPFLLAVDQSSRKIAFFDRPSDPYSLDHTILDHVLDYLDSGAGDDLHLATMPPFGDQFDGFKRLFPEEDGPKLMRYVGAIPIQEHKSRENESGQVFERSVELGPAITNLLGDSLLQNILIQPDAIEDEDFSIYGGGTAIGISGSGQLLDESNMQGFCGSGGCSYTPSLRNRYVSRFPPCGRIVGPGDRRNFS